MKKILFTAILTLIGIHTATAQVGIGTEAPDASAQLELQSTTKGFLPPRMTEDDRDQISSPAQGLMIYCTDCGTNGEAQLYNGTEWTTMTGGAAAAAVVSPRIGEYRDGGIVFYVAPTPTDLNGDGTLDQGLVCAVSDQSSSAVWGCDGTVISGADGEAISTGSDNTSAILAGCSQSGIAAEICTNLSLNGYNDWFLPSKDELNEMYQKKEDIDDTADANDGSSFVSDYYWSSTEFNDIRAWKQIFGSGSRSTLSKSRIGRVRAVRAF